MHYFQWKTFSKSDRQEGSEPISKLNLNLFMFSLCIFVLVPKYSFSSNGYFLSLVFISLLCLKTAILFLLIFHLSNLMKQVLLSIFHEEKKILSGSSFSVPFHLQIHWSIYLLTLLVTEHFGGSSAEWGESSHRFSLISYLHCLQVHVCLYFACRN